MFVGLRIQRCSPFFGENQTRNSYCFCLSKKLQKFHHWKKNTLKKIWMKPSHYVFWSAMFIVIMVPIPTRSILQLTSFKSMPSSLQTPGLFHLILKLVRVIVHRIEKIQMIVLLSLSNPCFQHLSTIQLKKASCNFAVISHFYGRMYKVYQCTMY